MQNLVYTGVQTTLNMALLFPERERERELYCTVVPLSVDLKENLSHFLFLAPEKMRPVLTIAAVTASS